MSDGLDGFDAMIRWLEQAPERIERGAVEGMRPAVGRMQQAAQATDMYRDRSGATRASTVAVMSDGSAESIIDAAVAEGQQLFEAYQAQHPGVQGEAVAEEVVPEPGGTSAMVTSMMDYIVPLVTMKGGVHDFLDATLQQEAPNLFAAAAQGAADAFEGER